MFLAVVPLRVPLAMALRGGVVWTVVVAVRVVTGALALAFVLA